MYNIREEEYNMNRTLNTLQRFKQLLPFLKGDLIVLNVESGNIVVDAGNYSSKTLKTAATDFFHKMYTSKS
jgi:hypothetical protein